MAQLICSTKSGNDWTANKLLTYNITVVYQDFATFFEMPHVPQPTIPVNVLTTKHYSNVPDDATYRVLKSMDLSMALVPVEESAVDDFAMVLLHALGYKPRGRSLRTRKDLLLVICRENRHTKTDVCLIDNDNIMLLIQEDKCHLSLEDPQPQLIVEAIAAFTLNNQKREHMTHHLHIYYFVPQF